jgi:iron complex outermembrane receptor protein
MKLFSILLTWVFNFSTNQAQNKINKEELKPSKSFQKVAFTGVVKDAKNGAALEGATIFLHDIKVGAISNTNGIFATSEFPSGTYLVEVSFVGYATIIETITFNKNMEKNFAMVASVADNDVVTVTGFASASKLKQSAQPISIVKRIDLSQTTSTNIIDALSKRVPGLNNVSTGPAISKPIIRGLGSNRIVVINDGVRQEGQQWGEEHGIEIDENSVQKAEVIKGPASLMYGSDAMAGVVNILTNIPIEQKTIKANIGYQFLDNNGLNAVNGNIAAHLKNGFNWNVYGTYKSAKDYQNKYDGRVFNSRYNERNFGGYFGINKSWGYSHLLISNFNQQLGLVEGERDFATGRFLIFSGTAQERIAINDELESRILNIPYQKVQHFKIASDNNFVLGKGRVTANVAFQENKRLEFGDAFQYASPSLNFNLQTITYNFQYHAHEKNGWKTSVGINGMSQKNKNGAEEVLIPEYNQFDIGAFVFTKKTFEKYTFSGSLRADTRNIAGKELFEGADYKFKAFNKNFSNLSGSIGIAYDITKNVTLKLNAARGYRAPSVAELASNGEHEGTNRYEYGDNNLATETSIQFDAGIEINTEHFTVGFNAFNNNINNYTYYSKLEAIGGGDSVVVSANGPATAFKFRQGNAHLNGFELKFDLHPHPLDWLHFENNFSFVAGNFNQQIESMNRLPFMPAPRWQSALRADIKKIKSHLKNSYAKIEMDNVLPQNKIFDAYDTETITAAYTLFNIGIGTDIFNHSKKIMSAYFALNNISDLAYQNHLSRLKYTAVNNFTGRQGVFNMGRNYSIKLQIPLEFHLK